MHFNIAYRFIYRHWFSFAQLVTRSLAHMSGLVARLLADSMPANLLPPPIVSLIVGYYSAHLLQLLPSCLPCLSASSAAALRNICVVPPRGQAPGAKHAVVLELAAEFGLPTADRAVSEIKDVPIAQFDSSSIVAQLPLETLLVSLVARSPHLFTVLEPSGLQFRVSCC